VFNIRGNRRAFIDLVFLWCDKLHPEMWKDNTRKMCTQKKIDKKINTTYSLYKNDENSRQNIWHFMLVDNIYFLFGSKVSQYYFRFLLTPTLSLKPWLKLIYSVKSIPVIWLSNQFDRLGLYICHLINMCNIIKGQKNIDYKNKKCTSSIYYCSTWAIKTNSSLFKKQGRTL